MACVATHDLPPLAGWWEATDIAEDSALARIAPEHLDAAIATRTQDRAELAFALRQEGIAIEIADAPALPADIAAGAHEFVARSPAALMMVQADDLAGDRIGVNLPGTNRERANWRRRLVPPLPELLQSDLAQTILNPVRRQRATPG
jgi:glycogen operon protein